jgi:hypothetical protein
MSGFMQQSEALIERIVAQLAHVEDQLPEGALGIGIGQCNPERIAAIP